MRNLKQDVEFGIRNGRNTRVVVCIRLLEYCRTIHGKVRYQAEATPQLRILKLLLMKEFTLSMYADRTYKHNCQVMD